MKQKALVLFNKTLDTECIQILKKRGVYDVVISDSVLHPEIQALGYECRDIGVYESSESIYEANVFLEELSRLVLPDGVRITKSCVYQGYELWWAHYTELFLNFCLPYTRYKRLLIFLRDYENICLYKPPCERLFVLYLQSYRCTFNIVRDKTQKKPSLFPFGICIQIILTLCSVPFVIFQQKKIMIFIGDKFSGNNDFDPRKKFIYEALREKNVQFIEFVRSMESWRTVCEHAWKRRRPIIYATGIKFLARYISFVTMGHFRSIQKYNLERYSIEDSELRFKLELATVYAKTVSEDIWEIRCMKWIIGISGIRSAFITATNDRNFHACIGCKLNNVPTVGILHGFASYHYNVYDFMPAYDGVAQISVDEYGVWSEWWREYYIAHSKVYAENQIVVSGLMRPLSPGTVRMPETEVGTHTKVLLVSEIVAVPTEVIPYLDSLLREKTFTVYIKFRPHNDSFESWLMAHRPDILELLGSSKCLKNSMQEAIDQCDIVVGSQSTGVIEATLQGKPFVLFNTRKWGDYFDMKSIHGPYRLFAQNPDEFVLCVKDGVHTPKEVLESVRTKFFGDPYQNGSAWVVERLIAKANRR